MNELPQLRRHCPNTTSFPTKINEFSQLINNILEIGNSDTAGAFSSTLKPKDVKFQNMDQDNGMRDERGFLKHNYL